MCFTCIQSCKRPITKLVTLKSILVRGLKVLTVPPFPSHMLFENSIAFLQTKIFNKKYPHLLYVLLYLLYVLGFTIILDVETYKCANIVLPHVTPCRDL